jgi:hypothetical protein
MTLVIENSSTPGSLTLAREGVVVHECVFHGAGELATEVARVIEVFTRLDRVIVGIGPGSYTGLRVPRFLVLPNATTPWLVMRAVGHSSSPVLPVG